jgi:hypothetical protein
MTALLVVWVAITTVFAALMIWKALISMKEDDQLFLSASESHVAEEQRQIVSRVERLSTYATGFGLASAALLLIMGAVWLYRGIMAF